MMLKVLQEEVEDVALSVQEEVVQNLVLGLADKRLHDLVEVAAEDRLNLILLEEVKKLVHHLEVVRGLHLHLRFALACSVFQLNCLIVLIIVIIEGELLLVRGFACGYSLVLLLIA
jgi:hypothetical protein